MLSLHGSRLRALFTSVVAAFALILALQVILPSKAAALRLTLYVAKRNPNCSDAGPGSRLRPFCTIVKAGSVALAGQTVVVSSGWYRGQVTVAHSGAARHRIVFTRARGASVTVFGGAFGFRLPGRSWITVRGFHVYNTGGHGIYASAGSHIALVRNRVSYAGSPVKGQTGAGIFVSGVTYSLVAFNKTDHNSDHGIWLGGSARTIVRNNVSLRNARQFSRAAAGIHVANSHDNVIKWNRVHHNEDSGIQMHTGSRNNLVAANASWLNGDHGFDTNFSTRTRYVANTAFGNHKDGFSIEGNSTGTTLANCIAVNNGLSTGEFNLYVAPSSVGGFHSDYDLMWNSRTQAVVKFNNVRYATMRAFRIATGHDPHGRGVNPRFVHPNWGDLRLRAGSPAIDSANSGASGQPYWDAAGHRRRDDPNVRNRGAGPRKYDDRGAYERQPA
jgi:parallel beta-helix repeat protein